MKIRKHFLDADKAGLALGAVLLVTLTGCVGYVSPPQGGVYVAPPPDVTVAQDDYVYYPGYDVYYNSSRRQYACLDGGMWVSRSAPPGVSINVLMASPSARMDFHDSPANHHAEMVQRYPRNWAPHGSKPGRKDDPRDDHGQNNGR